MPRKAVFSTAETFYSKVIKVQATTLYGVSVILVNIACKLLSPFYGYNGII